jgi:hypothetical protein
MMQTNFENLDEIQSINRHGFSLKKTLKENMYDSLYLIEQFDCLDELTIDELDRLVNSIQSLKRIFKTLLKKNNK